jgi:signal transduction histidine kinase
MSEPIDPGVDERIGDAGDEVAAGFVRSVIVRQALVGVVAYLVVAILAPWALILESERLGDLWAASLLGGALTVAVSGASSLWWLRSTRRVFRALALAPERVEPADIGALANLPFRLTMNFAVAGALAATTMALPGIRPGDLDGARALSFALLAITIVVASAVVHYVSVRDATIRAVEISPHEPIVAWLEHEAVRLSPSRRVARRLLVAVVAPVALVGVGTVLVTHAHLRAFVEEARRETAVAVATIALDEAFAAGGDAGRDDAVAAAVAHGFFVRPEPNAEPGTTQLPSGQRLTAVPFENGGATVRYEAALKLGVITTGIWLALAAVLLAGLFGALFGRALAADLVLATQQVSSLGTQTVMEGKARVGGRARFSAVAALGRSVEVLAERFRVFAAAQERALRAKAAAQRMKQLLFASVSHDLKSPLNAILGFAEIVRDEPMTQAQLENLDMVSGRGRELLALIETILDAARVEAGQLSLSPSAVTLESFVADAVSKARDLHAGRSVPVIVEIPPDAPSIAADAQHGPRAVGVMIAHALEVSAATRKPVRIRAGAPRDGHTAVHIEYFTPEGRPSLLEEQLLGRIPTSSGRGMVLRLSLARAVIELHGGSVGVSRGPQQGAERATIVTCYLPM